MKNKNTSSFIDYNCGANVVDMQLISKFNKIFRFLLCIIDIFSKYAWIVPLRDKKDITITNAFHSLESSCKLNKIWVDKSSKFYNRSMKSWLQDNDIEI